MFLHQKLRCTHETKGRTSKGKTIPTQRLCSREAGWFGWLKYRGYSLQSAGEANAVSQVLARSDAEQSDC